MTFIPSTVRLTSIAEPFYLSRMKIEMSAVNKGCPNAESEFWPSCRLVCRRWTESWTDALALFLLLSGLSALGYPVFRSKRPQASLKDK